MTTADDATHEAARARAATERTQKVRAWSKVQRAILSGHLIRPDNCEQCGRGCVPEASHDDYLRPLDVEWLCRVCHRRKDRPDTGKCKHGHALEGENLAIGRDGYRVCRTCIRLASARHKALKASLDPMRGLRPRSNSTTGIRGVSPNGSGFRGRIKRNGKELNLGTFATVEEAAAAVDAARTEIAATALQEVA